MDSPASSSAQPTVPKSHLSKQQKKALIFFMISFLSVFYSYFYQILDEHSLRALVAIVTAPELWGGAAAYALGGAIGLPGLHILISSFFESKRNSETRCNIITVWSQLITIVTVLNLIPGFLQS